MQGDMQKRLLVMQPDGDLLSFLNSLFGNCDLAVRSVADAQELMMASIGRVPDAILLCDRENVGSLFQQCRDIRANEALGEVPIIVIGTEDTRDARREALRTGADDYFCYPMDEEVLGMKLRNLLKAQRFRRENAERDIIGLLGTQISHGLLILDKDGMVTYTNHAATADMDVSTQSGKTWIEQLSARFNICCTDEAGNQTEMQEDPRFLMMFEHSPESMYLHRWYRCMVYPLYDDPKGRRLVVIVDMTDTLEMQNIMLGIRRVLIHKLRTPINGLMAPLEMLHEDGLTDEERESCISIARHSVEELMHVVTRMEEYLGDTPREDDSECITVDQLKLLLGCLAKDLPVSGLNFRSNAGKDALIPIGKVRAGVVFAELLENAVKFHPEQKPSVDVIVIEQKGYTLVEVIDNGCNVSNSAINYLQMPFYQAGLGTLGNVKGSGIGLAQVQRIIYEAGGRIRFRNRSDGPGMMISMRFPNTSIGYSKKADNENIVEDTIPLQ